jgi:hypothetical protein
MQSAAECTLLALRDTYERLGLVIVANALWLMVLLGGGATATWLFPSDPVGQSIALALLLTLIGGPLTFGLYRLCRAIADREGEGDGIATLFAGFSRHFVRGAALAALNLVVLGLASVVVAFWVSQGVLVLRMLGFVWVWLVFLWCVSQCYAWPIVAAHDVGVIAAERLALYLVIAHPAPTALMVAQMAAVLALVGFPWLLGSGMLIGVSVMLVGTVVFSHFALLHTHVAKSLLAGFASAGTDSDDREPPEEPGSESEE